MYIIHYSSKITHGLNYLTLNSPDSTRSFLKLNLLIVSYPSVIKKLDGIIVAIRAERPLLKPNIPSSRMSSLNTATTEFPPST